MYLVYLEMIYRSSSVEGEKQERGREDGKNIYVSLVEFKY